MEKSNTTDPVRAFRKKPVVIGAVQFTKEMAEGRAPCRMAW